MTADDEEPDEIEYDPRWEVQPEPEPEDDSGSHMRRVLIAAVAMTAVMLLVAWFLANVQPAS